MAVFKLFPTHDSFIYTEKPLANNGRDELLEIAGYNTSAGGQTARTLIKWDTVDIKNAINTVTKSAGDSNYEVHLVMNLAMANELPIDISVQAFPLSSSWDEGTGKFGDSPDNTTGCSWRFKNAGKTNQWQTASYDSNVTGSYQIENKGGGVWYTNYSATENFSGQNNFDIETDITSIFSKYYDDTLDNNGIVLKLADDLEFNQSASVRLKYYGSNTNTIYPPHVEIRSTATGSYTGSLPELNDSDCVITLRNNKGEYTDKDVQRFRLHCRSKYPTRTFTTSSAYTSNNVLPTGSQWALKDENTEEMIFDYSSGTVINHDATSNYFDVFMDGLQPERYYRVLVKTEIDGSTMVVDTNEIFKVVRNV